MKRIPSGLVLLALACGSANASLDGRAGGLAYWDSSQNFTWAADANLAMTSGYDADGLMTWAAGQTWIASLNAQNGGLGYLGVNDWRLPTVTDTLAPGCDFAFQGTDCGFIVNLFTGEMARMFYGAVPFQLGNSGFFTTSGVVRPCASAPPTYCLSNVGPFSNLQPNNYWSGTEVAPNTSNAWGFGFHNGNQGTFPKTSELNAWAVRTGDFDADGDGVLEHNDNCALVANPAQLDSDSDGYGNICDGDINNSGTVTAADFGLLRSELGQPASVSPTAAAADMNGSGTVTTADFGLLRARLGTAPGPSGLSCAGTGPCP